MKSNLSNSTSCERATEVYTNQYYRNILIFECVFCVIAIFPNTALLSVISKIAVFPSNLRLLLAHLSLTFLWFSLGDIVKNIYSLSQSPCLYLISMFNCRLFDMGTTWLVLPNIFYALMPICVERLYATINYRRYDMVGPKNKPWLAYALIVLSWVTALLITGTSVSSLPRDQYVPICDGMFTFLPNTKTTSSLIPYFGMEIAAIFVTIFVYFYNRHVASNMAINRAKYNLSARFMIDQNVKINKLIVPSMILHLIFHIPAFILMIMSQLATNLGVQTGAIVNRLSFLWRVVYAVVHPMCAIYFNPFLRNRLAENAFGKFLCRLGVKIGSSKVEAHEKSTQVTHFDALNQIWSKPVGKLISRKNKVKSSEYIV